MRNKRISLAVLLLCSLAAAAQEEFTLDDLNFGGSNYRRYLPENRHLAWWGEELLHLTDDTCYIVATNTLEERPLFSRHTVNTALASSNSDRAVASLSVATFPYPDQPLCYLSLAGTHLLYDFAAGEVVWQQEIGEATVQDWCAANRSTALVRDNQLVVVASDGTAHRLTTDGDSLNIIYGQAVHRNEWGITKGTFWSPQGHKLAFYRMDQSMVATYPQVDIPPLAAGIATLVPDKYPMAGEASHVVTVGIYDLSTQQTTYLRTADPTDRYFTNIAWSDDEQTLYLFELNREQNDCRLIAYDSNTGIKQDELYRETSDKYVEPLHPIVFLPWDNSRFILQSQRDGYNHLYLFDKDSKEMTQLTKGQWVVQELLGFDRKNRAVIYASNEVSTMQRNTWRVDIRSGRRTLLDSGEGWHNAVPSAAGTFVADTYSTPTTPRNIDIITTRTARRVNYLTACDPWAGHKQPTFTAGTLLAADDSTLLNYRLVLPCDFDPTQQYPTIVYVYGGPHDHCVDARWHYASRSWETYMAQKGYIIFVLDNRGSENRGIAFEQTTFHHLGEEEMRDQMRGVAFLTGLPYVDATRIGVHGWSFGGFMTINLMTSYPDVFKVGVAGGPVVDWRYYEVMYGERYMGMPQTNAEGYARTSLIGKAKNLRGKLQVVIGYNDDTVVPQHALSFLAACIVAEVPVDFFVYPGEKHNMRGRASVHLHERITQYFEDYLKK